MAIKTIFIVLFLLFLGVVLATISDVSYIVRDSVLLYYQEEEKKLAKRKRKIVVNDSFEPIFLTSEERQIFFGGQKKTDKTTKDIENNSDPYRNIVDETTIIDAHYKDLYPLHTKNGVLYAPSKYAKFPLSHNMRSRYHFVIIKDDKYYSFLYEIVALEFATGKNAPDVLWDNHYEKIEKAKKARIMI